MLGAGPSRTKEIPEFNRCDFAAGGKISFVLNVDARIAVAAEKPSVTVFAMIDFRLHFNAPVGWWHVRPGPQRRRIANNEKGGDMFDHATHGRAERRL
jgi:hypothetical protein